VFESKPIKRGGKNPSGQPKKSFEFQKHIYKMSYSNNVNNNNTFTTAPTSPNPYVSRKLNNMDQAQVMKREREDWLRMYHKTLKGIEAMIDVQRAVKNMKKVAEEVGTTVAEMEGTILTASINNRVNNAMDITQMAEDLRYLIQSDMDDRAFQVQRRLADELDQYKGKGNSYVDANIREIQEIYMDEEVKKEGGRIEEEEVILIKPYEVSSSTSISTHSTSFIEDEIENLIKYMKFVKSPTQTRLFRPPPHYQSLKSRGEQDTEFWKEIATALVDNRHNTETSRNGLPIKMYQGGTPHEPFFIAIDCRSQVIIGPNKKIVATHVVGELEVLI